MGYLLLLLLTAILALWVKVLPWTSIVHTTLKLMVRWRWLTNHWMICFVLRSRILVDGMLLFQRLNLSLIVPKIEILGLLLFRFCWELMLVLQYSYCLCLPLMLFLVQWSLGLIMVNFVHTQVAFNLKPAYDKYKICVDRNT